ncbi:hypothetical protein BKA61DRAFT_323396 [Leptodontidium sp. MPI-SDFR-AT-0119]|nr:hypothetical protein BKA61DRAFT_323396 [Leptodontidium sp. MPI-SDFR-AT-0119]
MVWPLEATVSLTHEDYTVAWLCALPIEKVAARNMLDELHATPPQPEHDKNIYTFGRICGHNVVIVCQGDMGTTAASIVATRMDSTFRRLRFGLLVGIAGGVPEEKDIRLGDVVASKGDGRSGGVVAHDRGKISLVGFESRPFLNGVPEVLRNAFSELESRLMDQDSKITAYLLEATLRNSRFSAFERPTSLVDCLFQSDYPHVDSKDKTCAGCAKDHIVNRPLRVDPLIHFGIVASGNQVIKNAAERVRISTAHPGVLAVEMEAAGLMDIFGCATIRGICDYADSHKNDGWHKYASATAAAVAKEVLGIVPVALALAASPVAVLDQHFVEPRGIKRKFPSLEEIHSEYFDLDKIKADCLRSLCFGTIDARENDITVAHQDTCDWLFKTSHFQQWRHGIDLSTHNGVLWIKGNPGAGKSTLMKHTLLHCQGSLKDHIIVVYFFNARGDVLEKSLLGMLRSLMYQLLEQNSLLFQRFIPRFIDKRKKHGIEWEWQLGELKTFLLSECKKRQPQPLLMLIDALDECDEREVREVVYFLEDISKNAAGSQSCLKICLSSRHYPTIGMQKKLELILEDQREHDQDIVKYVQYKLRVTDKQIEKEILGKARHIFLWVVLVVEMLNKAYDEGQIAAMQKTLREIPSDLDEVFWSLLQKDPLSKERTILMFQWVLFAIRQLTPEELYFAVLAGTESEALVAWDRLKIDSAMINRFITSTSRGLVEVRQGQRPQTVQFIHESVKDFLLRNRRLERLHPQLKSQAVGVSHDRLACICLLYIIQGGESPSVKDLRESTQKLAVSYPFLGYASTKILEHAKIAQANGISQKDLLHKLNEDFERFQFFHDTFETNLSSHYDGAQLLYVVSKRGYYHLVQVVLCELRTEINAPGGYFGNILHAAAWRGNEEVVRLLLEHGADVTKNGRYGAIFQAAAWRADEPVWELLRKYGAAVPQAIAVPQVTAILEATVESAEYEFIRQYGDMDDTEDKDDTEDMDDTVDIAEVQEEYFSKIPLSRFLNDASSYYQFIDVAGPRV